MNISRSRLRISENMACISLRSSLRILWTVAAASVFLTRSSAAPTIGGVDNAVMFLAKYGYLSPSLRNPSSGHIIDKRTWQRAVAEFQTYVGLNATGELDAETARIMSLPRCSKRDKEGSGESRAKRYTVLGSTWPVKNLTYNISNYSSNLNRAAVDAEIANAFSVWSDYTDLTFTQKSSEPFDIVIRFAEGKHGDGNPFDGPDKILGHAFSPEFGGEAHLNDAVTWTIDSSTGINLNWVAAHEVGHSLGLNHSDVPSAIMFPYYHYKPNFQLDQDDIQGIQFLYGPKTQTDIGGSVSVPCVPRATTQQPSVQYPALCDDPKIDTIFNSVDGETFMFIGEHYWRLRQDGVASGYPRQISCTWPGLPGNIDTAFTYNNGKTYFFKGSQYWRYNGQKMDGHYPKYINKGFPGIPDNLDASLAIPRTGIIYFYKGSKFWRYNLSQNPFVRRSYPLPLSLWKGLPNRIDAAIEYTNGYVYFFKAGLYWRFQEELKIMDRGFPRSAALRWLGCRSAPRGTVGGNARSSTHDDN